MADGPRLEPVHFEEAIDFFQGKLRMPTATWTDIWREQHARAFVVAGAMKDDLLKDFQSAIDKAISQGTTLEEFRKDFDRIVATHGWQYNGGRNWRSRVIFETNLQMAYSAGKWQQIQQVKNARPYLRYTALQGGDRRPEHQAWHGTILPVDDPWWQTHMPINGWGCKCSVQSLSDRDLRRYKLKVSDKAPPMEMEERTINTPSGPVTRQVPKGIDPGFDYNVGEAGWGRKYANEVRQEFLDSGVKEWEPLYKKDWQELGRPADVPVDNPRARLGERLKTDDEMKKALRTIFGADKKIMDMVVPLPDGSAFQLNFDNLAGHLKLERSSYLPFLPELLSDPFEIWLAFEKSRFNGQVALRKRFVKSVYLPKIGRFVFVANVVRGRFEGWTYFKARKKSDINSVRYGRLLYARDENIEAGQK